MAISVAPSLKVAPVSDMAGMIRDDAVSTVQNQFGGGELNKLIGRPAFLDNLKHQLALGVAQTLAGQDRNIKAVYSYDPELNADSETVGVPQDATLHLLVLVNTPSAALKAFVESLDRSLTGALKELPSPLFAKREFILDVNLITDKDVEQGVGYARLLKSVFTPPCPIWNREG